METLGVVNWSHVSVESSCKPMILKIRGRKSMAMKLKWFWSGVLFGCCLSKLKFLLGIVSVCRTRGHCERLLNNYLQSDLICQSFTCSLFLSFCQTRVKNSENVCMVSFLFKFELKYQNTCPLFLRQFNNHFNTNYTYKERYFWITL